MSKHRIICLSCDQEMPSPQRGEWHAPGCRDVGVVASNWEKRDGIWYLKGSDKKYEPMSFSRPATNIR
jgi:hypothetical protein